jgi:hypothetical protein
VHAGIILKCQIVGILMLKCRYFVAKNSVGNPEVQTLDLPSSMGV